MEETDQVNKLDLVKSKSPKERSGVAFPYYSLEKSIEVPRLIHQRAGGRCSRAQLASVLGYKGVKNGGFLTRISAAKLFGLIAENGDVITLTDRAKKILSPIRPSDAQQAQLDAFMAVELYKRVFEDFDGHTLPGADGLTNAFLTNYKVVPNQVATALRNMMDSAETAGLFQIGGRTKMIPPIMPNDGAAPAPPPRQDEGRDGDDDERIVRRPRRSAETDDEVRGGGGADMSGVHPALVGLIQNLPAVGATLGPKRRAALIDAFKSTINFIYPEDEEE